MAKRREQSGLRNMSASAQQLSPLDLSTPSYYCYNAPSRNNHALQKTDYNMAQNLQTLEQERFTLLARLQGCLDVSSSGDASDFRQSLLVEYNEATRVYNDALEASRTHSPDQLPAELWIKIIREAVFDQLDWPFKVLLPLVLVSRRWAAVIVETPSLWTSVRFPGDVEDFHIMMAIHLSLSNPLPLSLELGYNREYIEQVAFLLLPHAHRIEGLEIYCSEFPLSHPFLTQTTFTSLRFISLHGWDLVAMSSFLEQLGVKLPFVVNQNGSQDRNWGKWATADGKLTDLWLPLLDASTLEKLDSFASLNQFQVIGNDTSHTDESDIILVEPPTGRLGFRCLILGSVPWKPLQNIVSRCGTHLLWLSITLGLNKLCSFFDMLDKLPLLRHLELKTSQDHSEIVQVNEPKDTTANSSLESFSWTIDSSSSSTTLDITSYLATLIQKAPDMETVRISGSGSEIVDFTILSRLASLNSLALRRVKYIAAIGGAVITMFLHLRELTISGDPIPLKMLRSPSTSTLYIDLDERSFNECPLSIEGEHWSAVTTLTISCHYWSSIMSLGHIQLTKLQSLSISSWSFAANLFRNLAMLPDDLPVLKDLHVEVVMEWDIFLIMLERRLVAQSRGISGLRQISFSKGIPRYIRSIIIRNLQGYIVERPSNHNLSLQANCKAILDLSIPGCIGCHLQHIYCPEPVLINTNEELFASLLRIYTSTPAYPETEAEILETWESRFKRLWSIVFKSDEHFRTIPRSKSCNRYRSVELTRDSIIEEFANEVPFAYLCQAVE